MLTQLNTTNTDLLTLILMRGTNILSNVTIPLKNYINLTFSKPLKDSFKLTHSLSYLENLNTSLDVCATPSRE